MEKGEASSQPCKETHNDEDLLEETVAWIDEIPLSRPKRNMSKDFSDGVLLAELLKLYYPKLVDMHNYVPANSKSSKLDNWAVLNRKVLSKLKLTVPTATVNLIVAAVPGEIQKLLVEVREKIKADEKDESEPNTYILHGDKLRGGSFVEIVSIPIKSSANSDVVVGHQKMVAASAYEKKRVDLLAREEEVAALTQRVSHLESLILLKDQRIKDLNLQLCRQQEGL